MTKGTTTMKTLKSIFTGAFAISVLTLAGFVLTGCEGGKPQMSEVEVVSPTGCLKSQGRYYDPKTKECVKVDNDQQAFVLDTYRYVNQLAEEGKYDETRYAISFSTYLPVEKVESFWTELRDKGAEMLMVSGALPAGYGYDKINNIQNPTGPKTWGYPEYDPMTGCGWGNRLDLPSEETTIKGMLLAGIKSMEVDEYAYGGARSRPELRKAVLEDGDCKIDSMSIIVNPAVMRDFWSQHLDDIRGIQPQITTVDNLMHSRLFGPITPVTQQLEE
jgi:hypothetical protein